MDHFPLDNYFLANMQPLCEIATCLTWRYRSIKYVCHGEKSSVTFIFLLIGCYEGPTFGCFLDKTFPFFWDLIFNSLFSFIIKVHHNISGKCYHDCTKLKTRN